MYLAPEGDELEIATAAASFLADAMPIARLHASGGADMGAQLRATIGDMGWFGLAVPEDKAGSGLTSVEHALFFREVGRQCGPVDLLAQSLCAIALSDVPHMKVSDEEGNERFSTESLHAKFQLGEVGVALLVKDDAGFRIIGAADAEWGLLVTPDMASLHKFDSGDGTDHASLDPANSMRFLDALPPGGPVAGRRTWQFGQLGAAAMLVGIAEAALDLIVDYAQLRETFGRKIGSWQAVRHPCADMAVRAEAARSQLWFAAAAIKEGRRDAQAHLDAAKHCANQAALGNTDTSIQLHGGIGVTDEHDCHLLLKHALLLSRLFGGKRALLANLLHAKLED